MKKYNILLCALSFAFTASAFAAKTMPTCTENAPLFTTEKGIAVIKNWGTLAYANSPKGSAGYKDTHEGAAHFTLEAYTPDAVLLPTVSHVSRVGLQSIYDYFIDFLGKNPKMTEKPIVGGTTFSGCGVGVMSGYYDFTLQKDSEPAKLVHARYTMQFEYLSKPREVSVTIMEGPESGSTISYTQPIGWYVNLQNSAALPAKHEEFVKNSGMKKA